MDIGDSDFGGKLRGDAAKQYQTGLVFHENTTFSCAAGVESLKT